MKNIECEIRSFISKEQYLNLIKFFKKEATFVSEEKQETHYLIAPFDLRVQKNKNYTKIWSKEGVIHDEQRQETEIFLPAKDFSKILKIFNALGHSTKIKWLRHRLNYKWQNISVSIDDTVGYGYIIELEKMSDQKNKNKTTDLLKKKMTELKIDLTPRETFEKKYKDYKINWKRLIK